MPVKCAERGRDGEFAAAQSRLPVSKFAAKSSGALMKGKIDGNTRSGRSGNRRGFRLGAATVQRLHAQAKPPAYVISEIDLTDKDAYSKEFVPLAVAALRDSGQKQLAAGGRTVSLSGEPPKARIVVSVFESLEKAQAAYTYGLH